MIYDFLVWYWGQCYVLTRLVHQIKIQYVLKCANGLLCALFCFVLFCLYCYIIYAYFCATNCSFLSKTHSITRNLFHRQSEHLSVEQVFGNDVFFKFKIWLGFKCYRRCWVNPPHTTANPGPRFNIKMPRYQYRKSHCGDKTVVRSSYLHNGISYTGKISLYWIRPQSPLTYWGRVTHIFDSKQDHYWFKNWLGLAIIWTKI